MKERSENTNKKSRNRTQVEDKQEDRLGVGEVGLGFPSAVEEVPGSDGKKSGSPGLLSGGLVSADSEIESWQSNNPACSLWAASRG